MKAQHGHKWTTEELKKLIALWSDGVEVAEIATILNSTRYAISKVVVRLRQEGIPLARRTAGHRAGRRNKLWTPEEIEYVVRRRNDRIPAEQIANELDRSFSGVQGIIGKLRREKIPIKMLGCGVRRLWSAESLKIALVSRGLIEVEESELN